MLALLQPSAATRVAESPLSFCGTPSCDVVYFGPGQSFDVAEVRVDVWQKQTPGNRVLCYCFGENEGDIVQELASRGVATAIARIRAHIAADDCQCELRSPQGHCCLGDVMAAAARARAALPGPHLATTSPRGTIGSPYENR